MDSIESFLADVQRAAAVATDAGVSLPGAADPLRLARIVMEGEKRRRQTAEQCGVPVPRFCIFSVTWRCNLDCLGCYAANYARGRELTGDEIERVIRELTAAGTYAFVIAGGEPLLLDGLLARLAGARDALFILFTNGTLLAPPEAEAILEAGNILPVVSVDGPPAETDARRGRGTWQRAAAAMDALRAAGAPFAFASMVTHDNLRRIGSRAWFDRMWQAGARFAFLIDYIPFEHNLQPAFVLTDDDMAAKRQLVAARRAEARPLVMNFPPDEYAAGACHAAGVGMLHVNADGYVEPCPYSHFAADNVRDKPFADVLASPFLSRIRAELLAEPDPLGRCLLFSRAEDVRRIAAETGAFFTERP